jgi:PadR family transcriptional regulator PadR
MGRLDQMRKGTTTVVLLKLLADSGEPLHGYEIIKRLERRGKGQVRFKEGLIYPRLHRMEQEGLLNSQWLGEPGTRRRKVYVVTEKGHARLEKELEQWATFREQMRMLLDQA